MTGNYNRDAPNAITSISNSSRKGSEKESRGFHNRGSIKESHQSPNNQRRPPLRTRTPHPKSYIFRHIYRLLLLKIYTSYFSQFFLQIYIFAETESDELLLHGTNQSHTYSTSSRSYRWLVASACRRAHGPQSFQFLTAARTLFLYNFSLSLLIWKMWILIMMMTIVIII